MLPNDPHGKIGPKKPLPDQVSVMEPKDEQRCDEPYSEQKLSQTKPGYEASHM